MSTDLVKAPICIVDTGRKVSRLIPDSSQSPTSQNDEAIGMYRPSTVPSPTYPVHFSKACHRNQGLCFLSHRGSFRAASLSIICALFLVIVPSLPINGYNGVYLFFRAIVQKDGTSFGLAYSGVQSYREPLQHVSDSDTDISNRATLIKRLDGPMQEGSIILIADIIALVLFVVVIAAAGWVLLRKRRKQADKEAQPGDVRPRQSEPEASQPQNATTRDAKDDEDADDGHEPRTAYPTNSFFARISTPGSSTFRSLRISMIPTPTRVYRPMSISNPIGVKSTMEWHELDPYPYPGFGPEALRRYNSSKSQQRDRQGEPAQTMLSRQISGATTLSNVDSLRKLAGILEGNMRFSGASYPDEAALSETTHGILSRQASSSSSRFSVATVVSPKDGLYRVSSDAPDVPPIPLL